MMLLRKMHMRRALVRAAKEGDEQRIRGLLEAGVDVEAASSSGRTALHAAAAAGHASIIPLLVTPSLLDKEDAEGYTPLQLAAKKLHQEAVETLMAAGASLGPSTRRPSPFNIVICCGWGIKVPQLLLLLLNAMLADQGSPGLVEQALRLRHYGSQPLHIVCSGFWMINGWCWQEVVARMVEAGADLNAVDCQGRTPLFWAVHRRLTKLVPLLVSPVNVNQVDPDGSGSTPLHVAAKVGDEKIVKAILAVGAKVGLENSAGQTALDVA
jgi:ankyrin repeat protein